jgi:hypothetical protein
VALVLGAVLWDVRAAATEPHPFAGAPIPAGSPFAAESVEWRHLPAGAFAIPDLAAGVAAVDLAPGEPITGAVVADPVAVPEGWWAVPVDLSSRAAPGTPVLLVVTDPPLTVPGVVVTAQRGDRFAMDHAPAIVAVPGEMAPLVAAAERAGMLVAATRP